MGLIWFLIFSHLLATGSPLSQFRESEPRLDQSGIHLNIYHVQGSDPKSPKSMADVLARDEARVKTLIFRLTKKDVGTSASLDKSGHLLGPKSVSIPVSSGLSIGSGDYYVKIGLGNPVKYYAMILDSGSSLSWLQCQPCTTYCHTQVDPLFNPSASKTYQSVSCATSECSSLKEATLNDPSCDSSDESDDVCVYIATYGDQSYSVGYLSRDSLTLNPSQNLSHFVFGCGQNNQGLFGRSAGIVGLGRQKLSMLAQLSTKYGYAFSYCLPTATATAKGGGFLSIGKASVSTSGFKFTPMITDSQDPSLYSLRLTAITVAGKSLGVAAAMYRVPTIIDSGTVITRLPMSVYAALRQAIVKLMSKKYAQAPAYSILDTCFKGSRKNMSVPEVQMVFQGRAGLSLGASNVLVDVRQDDITCLAFASSSEDYNFATIGNHQQQTFKVAYDISNSRIGFAAHGCR